MTPPRRSTCPGPTMSSSVRGSSARRPPRRRRLRAGDRPRRPRRADRGAGRPGARRPVVHADADERVPVRVRRLLRPGGLPGRRGRRGRPGSAPRARTRSPSTRPATATSRGSPARPATTCASRRCARPPARCAASARAAAGASATRSPPARPSSPATAAPSPHRPAANGGAGSASRPVPASTSAPRTSRPARRVEVAGNEAQCAELATILARRMAARPVIFGGDVNRRRPCAPAGLWTRTDDSAGQAPSLQHVYGSRVLRSPAAHVVPARYTDHDVLVIRARAV